MGVARDRHGRLAVSTRSAVVSTKISKGARRYLLALYTPGVPCTLTLYNRVSNAAKQAARSLKRLESAIRGDVIIVGPASSSVHDQMLARWNRSASTPSGKVTP
jgi:hypothetical protein